jgi:hypothetical protein
MLDHIEYVLINKTRVLKSVFLLPMSFSLVLFSMILLLVMLNPSSITYFYLQFSLPFINLFSTAIVWIPVLIGVLFIEVIFIRKNANERSIQNIFLLEAVLCSSVLFIIFFQQIEYMILIVIPSFAIGELWRWKKLIANGKLYNSAPSKNFTSEYSH